MSNTLEIYGPNIWHTIHTLAANYNPKRPEYFFMFINSLKELIPCDLCKKHFKEILQKKYPIKNYTGSRELIFLWSYLIHDEVNKKIGKISPPYKSVQKFYMESCGLCTVKS